MSLNVIKHGLFKHIFLDKHSADKHSAIAYNPYMDKKKYANFRAFKEDVEVLKVVAAICRESMVQTFKRLVQQEYTRLQQEGGQPHAADKKDPA